MALNARSGQPRANSKAQILQEAIHATGGPSSEAIGAIRNYVEDHYPNFPWESSWSGQILSAKSKMQCQYDNQSGAPLSHDAKSPLFITRRDVELARDFIEHIGGGDIEKAKTALAFLESFGSLAHVGWAIDAWSELIRAVGGDSQIAERTLQVVIERFLPSNFPRLAGDTVATDAA